MTAIETKAPTEVRKFPLTTMVVGSMVGAGIFSLPRNFPVEMVICVTTVAGAMAGIAAPATGAIAI